MSLSYTIRFGFPVDLTNIMAIEKGFSIDEVRFNEMMEATERTITKRGKTSEQVFSNLLVIHLKFTIKKIEGETEFTGYDELRTKAKVLSSQGDADKCLLF